MDDAVRFEVGRSSTKGVPAWTRGVYGVCAGEAVVSACLVRGRVLTMGGEASLRGRCADARGSCGSLRLFGPGGSEMIASLRDGVARTTVVTGVRAAGTVVIKWCVVVSRMADCIGCGVVTGSREGVAGGDERNSAVILCQRPPAWSLSVSMAGFSDGAEEAKWTLVDGGNG